MLRQRRMPRCRACQVARRAACLNSHAPPLPLLLPAAEQADQSAGAAAAAGEEAEEPSAPTPTLPDDQMLRVRACIMAKALLLLHFSTVPFATLHSICPSTVHARATRWEPSRS